MTVTIYLCGVFISAIVWFALIKVRQRGFYIPMPRVMGGNLLDPMNHKNVDYNLVMVGWGIMSFAWPLAWAFLGLMFVIIWIFEGVRLLWGLTLGNERVINKIFGVKGE